MSESDIRKWLTIILLVLAMVVFDFYFFYSAHIWLFFPSVIFLALDKGDADLSIPGIFIAASQSPAATWATRILSLLIILLFPIGLFFHWHDKVTFVKKAYYHLEYFSSYSTLFDIRLHNECWQKILSTNFDASMLVDADGDGQSQYCETFDHNFLISPNVLISNFIIQSPSNTNYILGAPFVWENKQTRDPAEAINGYEIIFLSRDTLGLEDILEEKLETCADQFDETQRVFTCRPSEATIEWLSSHALTHLFLTVRSFDLAGRRQILVSEIPIHISS